MRSRLGTIAGLWRYPVKSMQGERLAAAPIGPAGLLGDRLYAVVEAETGRVASAKHPRRWGALLACRAELLDEPARGAPPVAVTLPDGTRLRSDDPRVHAALSALLGHAVRLAAAPLHRGAHVPPGAPPALPALRETDRTPLDGAGGPLVRDEPIALAAPAGTWFDVAPVHLLTTATLAALGARAPASRFDARRFRPNVLVETPEGAPEFAENAWIGAAVGAAGAGEDAGATLDVIDPTPRCVVTTLPVGDLGRDPGVLRAVVAANAVASRTLAPGVSFPGVAGVYATVRGAGALACGDALVRAG